MNKEIQIQIQIQMQIQQPFSSLQRTGSIYFGSNALTAFGPDAQTE